MKNLVFGLLFLGLTTLSYSQESNIVLEAVTIKPLNLSYLKKVQNKNTPVFVKKLENEAARYDITESPLFEKEFEAYEVVFRTKKKDGASGQITATYDSKGKIIKVNKSSKTIV